MGGRPLVCNYPYECADGEWTGPVWGSDSDQGDDCAKGVETDTQTDGGSLAKEEDRMPPSLACPPPKKPPARRWTKVRGCQLTHNMLATGQP